MFKNYLKVAFRNLVRNKGFSIINISGFAIGMASAILILLWIRYELSYDRFHRHPERLYQVWSSDELDGGIRSLVFTPQMLAPALKKDYPEVEDAARIGWSFPSLFSYKDKKLKITGTWADPSFLTMFNFPVLRGDARTALHDPYSVVITQRMAKKLFGDEDPIGKLVKIDNSENFTVTALLKDVPDNTQFEIEYLNSSEYLKAKGYFDTDWTDISIRTFALLKPGTSLSNINAKIKDIDVRYSGNRTKTTSFLYPVSDVRLYSDFKNGKAVGGRIEILRTFGLTAVFILLIACINFMNLSTARSEKRAKEVGIRQVSGALKKSLISQFLGESVLMALIAGIFALIIVQACLPAFNQLTQKRLFLDFGNVWFWMAALGFILFTGLLAGSYPAFYLSAFKPVSVLKGSFKKINALITPRKVLVVLQFSFAIVLIISTIIVQQQIQYAQQRKTGYDKNNLIYLYLEGDMVKHYDLIKNELLNSGTALSMSRSFAPLTEVYSSGFSLSWQGKGPNTKIVFNRSSTDGNLVKTAGLKLIQGRDIDVQNYPTDSTACLINESAAKAMGFKNPLGQTITDDPITWHIVGVFKDFIMESPYQPIKPLMFKGPKDGLNVLNIKLNRDRSTEQNLAKAAEIFKTYNPEYPFDYHFVDEEYAKKFNDERLTGKLAGLFAGLTIFISCLGLFGLATFMAENRIKEIGVRKVLGASITNITILLSKDFVKLVITALLIATPVAWWLGSQWLTKFDYRIGISAWIFVFAGLSAILIALMTVGYQSIKAATANPVKNLRTE
jgi:putative ABC transport system permease protein